ncbi:MarR family transcriptional regulator [Amycolatopsis carbonis]|uniref:MarR family transcriptional regulator n=1 Tax=Amycolatopsis carbonis TaxID=715471 RepID=A0A9Y2IEB9_9PSEU|nr:MarR family transcriptional regulator [Amycolatopsis sp. 2-15]WIX77451.1 MarR family transcriptional regulator [Amycolatopsis sp. 2-15]
MEQPSDLGLVDGLARLSFLVQGELAPVAAEHGLSLVQLRLLGILRDRTPGMQELARHLELDKSSTTASSPAPNAAAWIQCTPAPHDGRAVLVARTADGHTLAREGEAAVGRRLEALAAGLTEAQRTRLAQLASLLVATAG